MKPVVVSGELALSAEVMYSRVAGKPTLTAAPTHRSPAHE